MRQASSFACRTGWRRRCLHLLLCCTFLFGTFPFQLHVCFILDVLQVLLLIRLCASMSTSLLKPEFYTFCCTHVWYFHENAVLLYIVQLKSCQWFLFDLAVIVGSWIWIRCLCVIVKFTVHNWPRKMHVVSRKAADTPLSQYQSKIVYVNKCVHTASTVLQLCCVLINLSWRLSLKLTLIASTFLCLILAAVYTIWR